MHYYLWTIGCQMNFADSRRVAEELQELGFREAGRPEDADLVLLNTCVVRQSAEDKVVGRLTSLSSLKRKPQGLSAPPTVALMGCFVTEIPTLQRRYPWIDAFIKPSDIDSVVQLAKQRVTTQYLTSDIQPPTSNPVSAGVPISYGCDHLCTYCVVRLRRGPEVSRPVEEIVAEVQGLVGGGVKEITLLGQNVDSYAFGLADLLEAVHEVGGLDRIRFLTSHPAEMSDRLIETAARLPKVCEHVEIPVQSGNDAVLRRMGRGYTVTGYRELVARIRAAMPGAGLATDVIVGFPGETEANFERLLQFLEEAQLDRVGCFTYSPVEGATANQLPNPVPEEVRQERLERLMELQAEISAARLQRKIGQTVEVLVDAIEDGQVIARSSADAPEIDGLVYIADDEELTVGEFAQVKVIETDEHDLYGVRVT